MGKWKMVRLGDVTTINMGQSPSSETYNNIGDGLPFFQGKADFGLIHPTVRMYCSEPKKIAENSSILLSVRAPVGAVNIATQTCCIGRGLAAISEIKNVSHYRYLFYFLKYKESDIANMGVGSTFKAISRKDFDAIQLPLPPLDVQQKIADVLDKASALIELRRAQLDKLDLLIKSQFIEMFGDPILNTKGFETKRGVDLFKISNGKAVSNEKRFDDGIPAYGGNGISWYTDEVLFDKDTIVIGRVGFQSGNVHLVEGPLWITDNAMYISEFYDESLSLVFLCEMMEHIDFTKRQDDGDLKKVTQKPFMEMSYILPSMTLQNEYMTFVQQVDKSKFAIQQSLSKLELNYKSLMQKCFRGELF